MRPSKRRERKKEKEKQSSIDVSSIHHLLLQMRLIISIGSVESDQYCHCGRRRQRQWAICAGMSAIAGASPFNTFAGWNSKRTDSFQCATALALMRHCERMLRWHLVVGHRHWSAFCAYRLLNFALWFYYCYLRCGKLHRQSFDGKHLCIRMGVICAFGAHCAITVDHCINAHSMNNPREHRSMRTIALC